MTFKSILGRRKLSAILLGAVFFALAALLLWMAFRSQPQAETEAAAFTLSSAEGERVYIEPQYMSEEFANFSALESDRFYLMLSPDLDVYIVCVSDSALDAYKPLQDYTYSDSTAAPEIPRVTGQCVEISDELAPYAVDAINTLFGSGVVSADTLSSVVGSCYIDTTAQAPGAAGRAETPICAVLAVLCALMGAFFVYRRLTYARVSRSTLASVSGLDEEFDQPDTQTYPKAELFLTRGFLGGYSEGLRAVPLARLRGVRGLLRGRRVLLCADDCDGVQHILCAVPRSGGATAALETCVADVSARVPGLVYGADRLAADGRVDAAAMGRFYAPGEKADLRVREQLDENGQLIRPNYALGVLGAVLGAALGVALWVGVGMLGYIIGLAGAAIIWLSMKGYQLFGGVLDRFGAIFSAVLSALCIPLATYLTYAWTYYHSVGSSRYSFGRAFLDTWGVIRGNGLTESCLRDLGLGLLFFALAGWPLLKTAFAPVPGPAAAAGAPAAGTDVSAAAEQPADETAARTLTHPRGLETAAMVASIVGAALFLLLAVMMVVSGEEDVLTLTLMCVAFAAVFAVGGFFAHRSAKSVIEYDALGVRLLRPGKPVELRWSEVTGLRLSNPNRMAITGAAGTIRFDQGWKGWQQLSDFARAHVSASVGQ